MAGDVTGFGSSVTIRSLNNPQGITITEAADDIALFEIDDPVFGTVNVGANGHKISYMHGSVYTIRIAVFANGDNDKALKAMVATNRPQQGASINIDSINVVFTEGITGKTSNFADCTMTSGALCNTLAVDGKLQARVYTLQGTMQAF